MRHLPRSEHLRRLKSNQFDLLIIGAGASGTGVAFEAATRGIKCAVIDQSDFAGETSGKSSKLLHGGIRYLQQASQFIDPITNFKLVNEALMERVRLQRMCRHMTNWVTMCAPLEKWSEIGYYFAGLSAYHAIANSRQFFGDKQFKQTMIERDLENYCPNLQRKFKLGVSYMEGQSNDVRYLLNLLIMSANKDSKYIKRPISMANYVKFEQFTKQNGRIQGGMVQDLLTQEEFVIKAKIVVNCTGPFGDSLRQQTKQAKSNRIIPTHGAHITLPKDYLKGRNGIFIPSTVDGRVLVIIPWEDVTLVGSTDSGEGTTISPIMRQTEKEYLINEVSRYFNKTKQQIENDILSCFAGVRPVIKDSDENTLKLSRKHQIEFLDSGFVSVLGGKWTIFRAMGEDAINQIRNKYNIGDEKSISSQIRVDGDLEDITTYANYLINKHNISRQQAEKLAYYYGKYSEDVLAYKRNDQLVQGYPYLQSQVIYGIKNEYAVKPMDILARRLRLSYQDYNKSLEVLPQITQIMQQELNWSDETTQDNLNEAKYQLYEFNPAKGNLV